ncbi:TonB-dependent siderophore receptor [Acinetobacter sp. RIT698]|uniref:TonB-dependent siderophore receptor n=2 Tax=Acinetobacter TaxID=469 RepID=A0A8X8KCP4_ACIGI|nr:TonB-dependent siderophore receptor [Acinetobacter guillouiae]MCF0264459.1 TonB-dependent siderophore receptor [Acinetobacter guillouiae]MRT38270.1 TonB-dependent siderophore receptor [Acinetobacter sp. RIT698]
MSSTRMQMTDKKYLSKMIQMIMLGLTSVAATTLLHATEETTQNNAEPLALPTLKFTANQLGEITENSGVYTPGSIATATRLVLKPKETPQTISVITRQEMDDFNLNSIDDVMRHTPGVSVVTYDSERTEYYSRGFAIQNFQYDGIPMNRDSAYSAGNTLSDMAIYDRIEVLKGATGLLTGVGDPGATINLIRKKPTKDFQGNVSLGLGTWNNYRGQIDLSGPLNETGSIRARGVAAYQDKESQLDRYERKTPVFYGILEADLTDNTLLTVGADYQDNKPKGSTWGGIPIYNSAGQFNKMPRGFNNGANWSNWEQYTRTIFSTLEHKFDNDWVAKIQLNHQINGYDAQLGAAAGGHPNPSTGTGVSMWAGNYKGETKSDAADIYATGPFQLFGREHELVVGASISESTWKNNGYGTPTDYKTSVDQYYQWNGNVAEPDWQRGNHWSNNETTKQNGFYLTSRLNLHDDLKVILGGRIANYKSEETKESGIFIPYVGAVYDLNDQYSVYASYSTIFKPQSAQNPNGKTLDPLEGENYEAGIKGEFFDGRLNASLAYYQLKQDNFAKEIPNVLTPSGGVASEALQGVKTKGAELEVTGEIRPGWNLHAGFNHKISKQDGIKQSTLTPENEFSLYTSYKLNQWVDGLTIGGGARWQDKTWGDVTNPLYKDPVKHVVSDYWLFDAMANYEVNDQLSVSFNVNNLLDEKYYTIFSWYSTYTWGEGRNYNLGLKYKF